MTSTSTTLHSAKRTSPGRCQSVWRRYGVLLIAVCLFLTGLALGFVGFREYSEAHDQPWSGADILYLTLQLFTLEAGAVEPPVPLLLNVGRFVAPLATLVTALAAAWVLFRDKLRRWLIRWYYHDHTVICGLGRTGLQLVEDLRRHGRKVVVIENDVQNDHIPMCHEQGAVVVVGDARSETSLHLANVAAARNVVATCQDDTVNVEIAVACHKLVENRSGDNLRCFVEVLNQNMCSLLQEHEDFTRARTPFELTLFNTYENAARQLFGAHPLDGAGIGEDEPTQVHLVIIGFGWMGQSVALQAARLAHFANRKPLRLTVIDSVIERRMMEYHARRPDLDKVCDLRSQKGCAEDSKLLDEIAHWTHEQHVRTTVVICLDDESEGFLCAMSLASRIEDTVTRILVRATKGESVRVLMSVACAEDPVDESVVHAARRLSPFGTVEECCSFSAIIDEQQDRLARAIHRRYVEQRESQAGYEPRPSTRPWPQLAHDFRESNRQAADHIPVKLRAIGCFCSEEGCSEAVVERFSEQEIELMAKMEHSRWCAERHLAGWTPGRDDALHKTTPHLVTWAELGREVQDYDRDQVRWLPKILREHLGEKIYRRSDSKSQNQSAESTPQSS